MDKKKNKERKAEREGERKKKKKSGKLLFLTTLLCLSSSQILAIFKITQKLFSSFYNQPTKYDQTIYCTCQTKQYILNIHCF